MYQQNLNINVTFRLSEAHQEVIKKIASDNDVSMSLLFRALCNLLAENKISFSEELEIEKQHVIIRHANRKPLIGSDRKRKREKNLLAA